MSYYGIKHGQEKQLEVEQKEVESMKSKFWMTVLALFCLGVGLLTGGCVYYPYYPQSSQRDELRPLVGGSGVVEYPGRKLNQWTHPTVMP